MPAGVPAFRPIRLSGRLQAWQRPEYSQSKERMASPTRRLRIRHPAPLPSQYLPRAKQQEREAVDTPSDSESLSSSSSASGHGMMCFATHGSQA